MFSYFIVIEVVSTAGDRHPYCRDISKCCILDAYSFHIHCTLAGGDPEYAGAYKVNDDPFLVCFVRQEWAATLV